MLVTGMKFEILTTDPSDFVNRFGLFYFSIDLRVMRSLPTRLRTKLCKDPKYFLLHKYEANEVNTNMSTNRSIISTENQTKISIKICPY